MRYSLKHPVNVAGIVVTRRHFSENLEFIQRQGIILFRRI